MIPYGCTTLRISEFPWYANPFRNVLFANTRLMRIIYKPCFLLLLRHGRLRGLRPGGGRARCGRAAPSLWG